MKIKVYAIGKIKEQYLKMGIEEYLGRIKPYSQIEIVEVNDEPINENPHPSDGPASPRQNHRADHSCWPSQNA